MIPRLVRVALTVALATPVVLPGSATAADIPTTRLFLHSASGSYQTDAAGSAPYTAPSGSTMTVDPPARASSATARATGSPVAGSPTTPSWGHPLVGTVRSVCVDLFISSMALAPAVPPTNRTLYITARSHLGGAGGTFVTHNTSVADFPGGIVRVTKWISADGPYDVDTTSVFSLHGLAINNPDWTLHYDSAAHFSSVVFNLAKDKCTPERLPAPKA